MLYTGRKIRGAVFQRWRVTGVDSIAVAVGGRCRVDSVEATARSRSCHSEDIETAFEDISNRHKKNFWRKFGGSWTSGGVGGIFRCILQRKFGGKHVFHAGGISQNNMAPHKVQIASSAGRKQLENNTVGIYTIGFRVRVRGNWGQGGCKQSTS